MLHIENLAASYGAIRAVTDVSLTVNYGQLVVLLGANGAGKTTVLHSIMGLLKPTSGEILLAGTVIRGLPSYKIVDLGISLVPEGRQLFPEMTVLENLEVSFARSLGSRLDRSGFRRRLDQVSIYFPRVMERRRQLAGTLSGGEQQMVAIARALVSEPRLLLLDEPSLGLSPVLIDVLMDVIMNLHKSGLSILLVEQNAQAALELADHAYVMERGITVLSGPGGQTLNDPRVQSAYLGF